MCDTPRPPPSPQEEEEEFPHRAAGDTDGRSPAPPAPSVAKSKYSWKDDDDDILAPFATATASTQSLGDSPRESGGYGSRDLPPRSSSGSGSGSGRFSRLHSEPMSSLSRRRRRSLTRSPSGFGAPVSHSSDGLDVAESPKDVVRCLELVFLSIGRAVWVGSLVEADRESSCESLGFFIYIRRLTVVFTWLVKLSCLVKTFLPIYLRSVLVKFLVNFGMQ